MFSEIVRLTSEQVAALLQSAVPSLTRKIVAVHLHHTWRPTKSQFKGRATIEAIRNFHVNTNGWDDIAQHLTVDPQGLSWTGRNWNLPPASSAGKNGTRQEGPFMIEMVGDFDLGNDVLDEPQRQAVLDVVSAILDSCSLGAAAVWFHRELGSPKTCPGTGIDKPVLLAEIQKALDSRAAAFRSAPRAKSVPKTKTAAGARSQLPFSRELVVGYDVVSDAADAAPGYESWEPPEHQLAADVIQDDARLRVRAAMNETRELATVLERTSSPWQKLRPHVVNLTQGRLSQGGEFDMPPGAIEGIVEAIKQYATATSNPRVMMHAHGGLVSEKNALSYALASHRWWLDQGVYPVYFVWETSVFEVLRNTLGLARGIGDWWDRRFESFARPIGKPLWSEMKEYALLASSPDASDGEAGGAWIFAEALSPLIKNPPNGRTISLHAVGHSAGAILHTHFVSRLVEIGLSVDSLAFLAPAVRMDLFKALVVPHLVGGQIHAFEMYSMDEEAERDDDLIKTLGIPVYGKSLLYLVSGAFEPEEDAAILGVEEHLEADAVVKSLFKPMGAHRLELSHAKGKPHNPATKARKHGCFDNDDATLQSVFHTIVGASAAVPFPVKDADCDKVASRVLLEWPGYATTSRSVPQLPIISRVPAGVAVTGAGERRALCVGIDNYPTSPLAGCVHDAQSWASALRSLRFDVTTLLDTDATRQRVVDALDTLIGSARPGDVLAFQYSGHGTQADDLNGDEADRYDEALVPVDYQSGALLLDDDLADVYRRLPNGAVLTLFMDCCHSGTNSRFAPIDRTAARGSERRRFLPLTPELEEAHRQYRARMGSPEPTSAEESLAGLIHFAACLDNQYAYESNGQGHFTRIATAALAAAVSSGATNESFSSDVAAKVIGLGRPQTPRLMRLPVNLSNRALLGGATAPTAAVPPGDDRGLEEWWLQFFETGAAYWRQRVGR